MPDPDRLETLTPDQRQAITHIDGPCLVIAGAGTGKTRVITERIAYLIEHEHARPEEIVALTFTEKAAGEMEARLDEILPYGTFGVTAATFHGFCKELLRRHSYKVGIDPNARLIPEAEQVSLLRLNLKRLPLQRFRPPFNAVRFLRDLIKYIEKLKEERITPEQLESYATKVLKASTDEGEQEQMEELRELAGCYQAVLDIYREANVLTYADLLRYGLEILEKSAAARKEEQERIKFLLIDEFQDTNTIQAELAYHLTGKHQNIFVVGDDDQAIYRFRGANVANILSFQEHFPKTPVISLTENFRSGQPILDASYQLIQHNNPHRLEVKAQVSKRLHANQAFAHPVTYQQYRTSAHEAEGVAQTISNLITDGYEPSNIAILARAHSHLDAFEQELINLEVPVQRTKEGRFYQEPSVEQGVSFLRFLVNPSNSENLFFLLAGQPFNVPIDELRELNVRAKKTSSTLWEQLSHEEIKAPELQEALRYLQEELPRLGKATPTRALRSHIKEKSDWEKKLVEEGNEIALTHLNTLYQQALSFEQLHRPVVLAQYLQHVDNLIESGEDASVESEQMVEGDGVRLMTVHASKGLEFPVVFVVNAVMRRFPGGDRTGGLPIPEELLTSLKDLVPYEEERRLMYVAMTRAAEQLYLTAADRYGTNKQGSKPSIFIFEALGTPAELPYSDLPLRGGLGRTADPTRVSFLTMPKRFSASALEAFEDNPLGYYHQHILHLISEDQAASDFGTCVHNVLRAALTARRERIDFDLPSCYKKYWVGEGFENSEYRDEQYQAGLSALTKYLKGIPVELVTAELEYPVELKLSSGYTISGKIDRLDRNADGSVSIIDYKTGQKEAEEADVRKNLPLLVYASALIQKGERVRDISLHYLLKERVPAVPISDKLLEMSNERIATVLAALEGAYQTGVFPEKKRY